MRSHGVLPESVRQSLANLRPMHTPTTAVSSRVVLLMATLAVLVLVVTACGSRSGTVEDLRAALVEAEVAPLAPQDFSPELLELGSALFFDPILSGNKDISCATCHEPGLATVDSQSVSIGTGGLGRGSDRALAEAFLHVPRNAPELFNRGDELWHTFFWDGRVTTSSGLLVTPARDAMPGAVDSVQVAQAMITIASPIEMRGFPGDIDVNGEVNELAFFAPDEWELIWDATFARLMANTEYNRLLSAAFPNTATADLHLHHAVEALVAFQSKAFQSTGSPFDTFVLGSDEALTADEVSGGVLFFGEAGCSGCHSGPLLTDQAFYSIAAPQVGPGRGDVAPLDAGFGALDGSNTIAFRTPPLRNVSVTAPYLHDGAFWNVEDVVRHHLDPASSLVAYDPGQLRSDVAVVHLPVVQQAVVDSLSAELIPVSLTDAEVRLLVAFLDALTDPGLAVLNDLVPLSVPSGLDLYPPPAG